LAQSNSAAQAREVVHQIVDAIRASASARDVEVALSPEELGRVRLSLSVDGGQIAHIVAERPETLDLIRRHIDLFAQELRAQGLGAFQFRFDGEGGRPGWQHPQDANGYADTEEDTSDAALHQNSIPSSPSAGLNLRL
jgi:flagellar hook-length control protein FliK